MNIHSGPTKGPGSRSSALSEWHRAGHACPEPVLRDSAPSPSSRQLLDIVNALKWLRLSYERVIHSSKRHSSQNIHWRVESFLAGVFEHAPLTTAAALHPPKRGESELSPQFSAVSQNFSETFWPLCHLVLQDHD